MQNFVDYQALKKIIFDDVFHTTPSAVWIARNGGKEGKMGVTPLIKSPMLKLELIAENFFF